MAELHESAASLRFFGEDLDPAEVTALLGSAPTHSYRKGDVRHLRDGDIARERRGHWRRVVERREPGDLSAQIEELFAGLTTDLSVWKQLSQQFDADVFCGLFMEQGNEGVEISSEMLLTLGSRGLKLDFDLYGPGGDGTSPAKADLKE